MRLEIGSATDFLARLLKAHVGQLTENQIESFRTSLADLLRHRYRDHWFPDTPNRGSGYRCIRINGKMDPVIAQAGIKVGLVPKHLHSLFPCELTMWIDPAEVSYRIGENGSICVLFETPTETVQFATERAGIPELLEYDKAELHRLSLMDSPEPYFHPLPPYPAYTQQQQSFEQTCKDSLLMEHVNFSEQMATYVSS